MKKLIITLLLVMSVAVHSEEAYHNCEYPEWQNNLYAMACNIFFEARGESLAGKMAVGFVTMNRVKVERFPDNVVDVVYQYQQFSWFSDGKSDKIFSMKEWLTCLQVSTIILQMEAHRYKYSDITEGSLFYHSTEVDPYWASSEYRVVTIDNHKFYNNDMKR